RRGGTTRRAGSGGPWALLVGRPRGAHQTTPGAGTGPERGVGPAPGRSHAVGLAGGVASDLGGGEALLEVGDDVVDRLEADREAHQARVDARGELLLLGELAVGRRGRVDGEAAHVADVGDVAVQGQRLDEALAGLLAALDDERRHRPEAPTPGEARGPLVPGRVRVPGELDAADLRVVGQELDDLAGVVVVPLDAQAQGLDALEQQEGVERA